MVHVIFWVTAWTAFTFGLVLLYLKVWDAIRAGIYNRREARLRALDDAFCNGYQTAMGAYARTYTYRAVLLTPDRPKEDHQDGYMRMVAEDIDEMTEVSE